MMRPYGMLGIAVLILTLIPLGASMSLTNGPSASVGTSDGVSGVYSTTNAQILATGQIQTAVDAAKPGATIFLLPKIYYDNVKVDKSLNIIGSGAIWTIVDGSKPTDPNFGSVFAIGIDKNGKYVPGVTANLAGLTIRKGTGTYSQDSQGNDYWEGGGINNEYSKLTVKNCILRDGMANQDKYSIGGSIYNRGGEINIINTQIFGNKATNGGGIFNWGPGGTATVNLINSQIFGNTAGAGGGIRNDGDFQGTVTVNLINSQIFQNTAKFGGGIHNGAFQGTATVNLIDSRISYNAATFGGGIYNAGDYQGTGIVTVNLQSGSIDHNTATAPAPSGGGIINDRGGITAGKTAIVHDNTPDQIVNA